jgi:hypothetical protein
MQKWYICVSFGRYTVIELSVSKAGFASEWLSYAPLRDTASARVLRTRLFAMVEATSRRVLAGGYDPLVSLERFSAVWSGLEQQLSAAWSGRPSAQI